MANGKDVSVSRRVTRAMEVVGRGIAAHPEDVTAEEGMRDLIDWAHEDSRRFIRYSDDEADWLMNSPIKITYLDETEQAVALGILNLR